MRRKQERHFRCRKCGNLPSRHTGSVCTGAFDPHHVTGYIDYVLVSGPADLTKTPEQFVREQLEKEKAMKHWYHRGFERGVAEAEVHDPDVIDSLDAPEPLNGEWAGQSIPEIFDGHCHEWQGTLSPQGYGRIEWDGTTMHAHRWAWLVVYGEIPEGEVVRHKCDNPACFRIGHLELGTQQDNIHDAIARGRWTPVVDAARKLQPGDLVDILLKAHAGWLQADLAKRHGVGESSISRVVTGTRWKAEVDAITEWVMAEFGEWPTEEAMADYEQGFANGWQEGAAAVVAAREQDRG